MFNTPADESRQPIATRERNFLALGPVGAIARSRLFPGVLQWATASVFALIVWQLLLGPSSAHDNAGTALVWGAVVAAFAAAVRHFGALLVLSLPVRLAL